MFPKFWLVLPARNNCVRHKFCVLDTKNVAENLQKHFLCPHGAQQCCRILPWTGNIAGHNVASTMCAGGLSISATAKGLASPWQRAWCKCGRKRKRKREDQTCLISLHLRVCLCACCAGENWTQHRAKTMRACNGSQIRFANIQFFTTKGARFLRIETTDESSSHYEGSEHNGNGIR